MVISFNTICHAYSKIHNPVKGVRSRILELKVDYHIVDMETYVESLVLFNKGTACNTT